MSGQTTEVETYYFQEIATGTEVAVEQSMYVEMEHGREFYREETYYSPELDKDWNSEDEMRNWFTENGYTDEY